MDDPIVENSSQKEPLLSNTELQNDNETETTTTQHKQRQSCWRSMVTGAVLMAAVLLLVVLVATAFLWKATPTINYTDYTTSSDATNQQFSSNSVSSSTNTEESDNDGIVIRIEKSGIHVPTGRPGFPSYWDYARDDAASMNDGNGDTTTTTTDPTPLNVTYDGRSFLMNGDRVILVGGSVHPIRMTRKTWGDAMDRAVHHGINLITICLFWNAHQQFPPPPPPLDEDDDDTDTDPTTMDVMDWRLSTTSNWTVADAVRQAASRGLFVHIRIGPYMCAEYNYGGIPEWLPLRHPHMKMRRLNDEWRQVMETYVTNVIDYLKSNNLFAHQGGNIILAQIENELSGDDNNAKTTVTYDDGNDNTEAYPSLSTTTKTATATSTKPTLQEYADWCGSLVERLLPEIPWTMCMGLFANNTILTCNGDCSTYWLENNGTKSGRIQVDQPAMWTEDEGGFQLWGDDPKHVTDYFWGTTARSQAYEALRWFARGGTHLNYYMWLGGYNRERASGAGIMNAYATDAPVCPSGQPREPKYSHLHALHDAIHRVAGLLLASPSALHQHINVEHRNENGDWEVNGRQKMFVYSGSNDIRYPKVVFVENDCKNITLVRFMITENATGDEKASAVVVEMNPMSAIMIEDGIVTFDSAAIDPKATKYTRKLDFSSIDQLTWSGCQEFIGASPNDPETIEQPAPKEQTTLNMDAHISSDYAWYETDLDLETSFDAASLFVESQKGSAMMLYIDGEFQGEAYTHVHGEGNITFEFQVGPLGGGKHSLAVLSESLGYHNLIGNYGTITVAKTKGITGDVLLEVGKSGNRSLADGRAWRSFAGLHDLDQCGGAVKLNHPAWSKAQFYAPDYDPGTKALFLQINTGRGHVLLNGHDLGRFWNITRGETESYSQEYYFLPYDFLSTNGSLNNITLFDVLGGDSTNSLLVLSWLHPTEDESFRDEVDFPMACI